MKGQGRGRGAGEILKEREVGGGWRNGREVEGKNGNVRKLALDASCLNIKKVVNVYKCIPPITNERKLIGQNLLRTLAFGN